MKLTHHRETQGESHPRREDGQRRQQGDKARRGRRVSGKGCCLRPVKEDGDGFGVPALALDEAQLRSGCRKR